MTSHHHFESNFKATFSSMRMKQQQGLVLFLALIALVVMSLAAVALIRSVDTNNLIAGNISFKQAATTSADAGVEAAITMLIAMRDNPANAGLNVLLDATHTFNITPATHNGYYSSANTLNLSSSATWDDVNNVLLPTPDASGNTIRYIVERMCRTPNVAIKDADCLFSNALLDTNGQQVKLPQNICDGPGCPVAGQTPQIRVTARVTGPKNSISYVQAFVY